MTHQLSDKTEGRNKKREFYIRLQFILRFQVFNVIFRPFYANIGQMHDKNIDEVYL
jgi:hypothetical protein